MADEVVVIDAILSPTSFSITTPLTLDHPTGALIATMTLTVPVMPGDTSLTVSSTAGLTPGTILIVDGEAVVVAEVTSGTTFTITSPFVGPHGTGGGVAGYGGFQPIIMIFDKGGTQLGVITEFGIQSPPTQALMTFRAASAAQGSMTFTVPRTLDDGVTPNPEATLVSEDRLVAVGLEVGGPLWAGSITVQESSGGVIQAECTDLFGQFVNTPSIEIDETVGASTPAWTLVSQVLTISNLRKAADNELTWGLEPTGTRPFRGAKFTTSADMSTTLEAIVENAGIELMWRADIVGTQLLATLIASDRFEHVSAFEIKDGADGNIMARPRIIRDPTNVVHEITLTGEPSDLSDCLPDYASWAIRNSTPRVTVSVDPGPLRRRARLDVSVPWGYGATTISSLCSDTLDQVWDMYYSFLRAIHDMEGRPFHEGYEWEGVPSTYFDSAESGAQALSRRVWRTRLQLVETYPNTPASAIYLSDAACQVNRNEWVIVTYNRQAGVQSVRYWGIPDATGASMTLWHMNDFTSTVIYTVSGTRIIGRTTITVTPGSTPGTGGFCESYNTRVYDPVANRYRQLRRLISSPFNGRFFDPADPDISLTDLGAGAGIDLGERSQLVGKIYDFELYNIDLWDPYRDGIGIYTSKPTIFNGAPTTMGRWHLISYSSGANASTSLQYGISSTEQDIVVVSAAGFPPPESADFPYKVAIDDGLDREVVQVIGAAGLEWHVLRAQDGTTGIIHEPGAPVHRLGSTVPDGLTPVDPPWPEGEAYARELLAMMSVATTTIELDVANIDDAWRAADFGEVLPITITTEGEGVGFDGTARVIGRSPDPFGAAGEPGSLRLVLEVVSGG